MTSTQSFIFLFHQLKSIGPKLVPFAKTACVYFVAGLNQPSILHASLKCLPIICLCFFIGMQGVSLRSEHHYNRHVLLGMVFSCLGDALMVWKPRLFIHSMVAFGIAQVIYVKAFGFRPFSIKTGLVCSIYGSLLFWLLYPQLRGIMLISVAIYFVLIMAMCWRAITRLQIDKLWKWNNMCACGGALLFAISDSFIAFDKFYAPIIYRNGLIMTTYYLAQLGIAMSTCKHNINDVVLNLHPENCKKSCLKEYKKD